jgi:catechol 2,3-dioxygenase-like lactoylglutathione lyase family enzyme
MSAEFTAEIDPVANHTALKVRDLKKALDYYSGIIGLPVLRHRGPADNPSAVWLPGLQLVVDDSADDPGTLDHIGIGVLNIEAACARLDAAGYEPETALVRRTTAEVGREVMVAFYFDPEGNKVELLKYLD